MNARRLCTMAYMSALWVLGGTSSGVQGQDLFRDNFDGNDIDQEKWNCPADLLHGWTRTRGCPEVSEGIARFEHHLYNPDQPGVHCLSQEINSRAYFARGDGVEFEAKVRVETEPPIIDGLVMSFFSYMDEVVDGHRENDEIDFEFLSNQINDPPEPEGHRVIIASYNDFWGQWVDPTYRITANPVVLSLNLGEWNVFKMRWWPDRIEWYWINDAGEDALIYCICCAVPDQPMFVAFNFWAATCIWPLACDPNLEPPDNPGNDVVSYYEVDYVVVTQIHDCNGNHVPDNVDIAEGTSTDSDENGIPDECEECPVGTIVWLDPPDGVVDARQPHPVDSRIPSQGIDTFVVVAPAGADDGCWALCEVDDGASPPGIASVTEDPPGTYTITLDRPITPGAVTTLTYDLAGGSQATGTFTSHPANTDGDSASGPPDILKVVDYINGVATSPWGIYSEDVDHSASLEPLDILRVIDLLNGAGTFDPWNGSFLPANNGSCP